MTVWPLYRLFNSSHDNNNNTILKHASLQAIISMILQQLWAELLEPTCIGVPLSDGGIMSADSVCGGSTPLLTFCWMRCIARANCSLVSFPICRVSARALPGVSDTGQRGRKGKKTWLTVWGEATWYKEEQWFKLKAVSANCLKTCEGLQKSLNKS